MNFTKMNIFCHPACQAEACVILSLSKDEGWTNIAPQTIQRGRHCFLEGSLFIMRFFVRNFFKDFLRKTELF